MGQTLSEPETTKHTSQGDDDRLVWAVSEMQGWRLSMEDAHATILNLDNPDESAQAQCGPGKKGKNSFFAVYDGHGGSTIARFSGDTVHKRLRALPEYQEKKWEQSMRRAFLKTDEDLRSNPDFMHDTSGCTAVATLITEDGTILCANSGDSRSILSVGGEAKAMSYDHKPVNKGENSRIVAAGGFVEFGRVNGNLALSRALGDFEFKQNRNLPAESQIVTADPDIITHTSTPEDEFLIIACDGIWDVLKSQEVIDFTRRLIADGKPLPEICEDMLDKCCAPDSDWGGVGCDNMTFMVVALLNGKTKDEWYAWVKDRVEKNIGYKTPKELPEPFSNRSGNRPGGLMGGGPLTGPAQILSNAINNGTLKFDQNHNILGANSNSEDDSEMLDDSEDADSDDQYHKSPMQMDDHSMNEDANSKSTFAQQQQRRNVASDTSPSKSVSSTSSAAPDKLDTSSSSSSSSSNQDSSSSASSILSPPSAVMGVQYSNSPHSKQADLPNAKSEKNDEVPAPAVKSDGLMDTSEGPLSG